MAWPVRMMIPAVLVRLSLRNRRVSSRPEAPAAVIYMTASSSRKVVYCVDLEVCAEMSRLLYQLAFARIQSEFHEMPGMHLTPEQVERLSGVSRVTCKSVLDDLVRAGFLRHAANGSYCRASDALTSRPGSGNKTAPASPLTNYRSVRNVTE